MPKMWHLGIKVPAGAYNDLARRAGMRGMSTTTFAGWILLDRIGHAGEMVIRKPRQRGVIHPLPSELRAGITLLRELQ